MKLNIKKSVLNVMLRCPEFLVSDRYAILYELSVMYFRPFSWYIVCMYLKIDE